MTSKSPAKIQKRIQRIKAELSAIDAMRPGSLTRQYKDPKNKRGAYYQLSYTRERKSRTEYVPRPCLPEVRREIRHYKRFKILTDEWVDLSIEQYAPENYSEEQLDELDRLTESWIDEYERQVKSAAKRPRTRHS